MNFILWSNQYSDSENLNLINSLNQRDEYLNSYIEDLKVYGIDIKNGIYTILSALDDNMVLDIAGGSLSDMANLQLWERDETEAQKFKLDLL